LLEDSLPQEQEQPQPQLSDDPVVEDLQQQAEVLEEAQPEPVLSEQKEFTFEDLDDIDVSSIPAEAIHFVQPILDHVKGMKDSLEAERHAYEDMTTQYSALISNLDEASRGNLDPLVQEYQTTYDAFTQVSTENVGMAHKLFELEYPEYESQSDDVKEAFVKALQHTSFNNRFEGENLYEKMVDAYKISVYRKGGIQPGQKPQPQVVAEVDPVRKPNPKAVKQSLVSGGEMAPNMPTLNLQEMSFDDILARGEHLLDL
tara:strand:- start:17937 stop:18710 length:774 start_codon:yes stop_codon:yes gene_type:complete